MLLAMTDALLVELGVKNALHRLAIKFAIEDLQASSGPDDRAVAGAHAAPLRQSFDVFLSYRRAGGADFAQLLKVMLKSQVTNSALDLYDRHLLLEFTISITFCASVHA
jgi:hypothetical protein